MLVFSIFRTWHRPKAGARSGRWQRRQVSTQIQFFRRLYGRRAPLFGKLYVLRNKL